jgi:tRNA(fMet)-specific endonuclease VapC
VTLLDTNVLIHFLKGRQGVVERMLAAPARELAVSTVSQHELEFGALRSAHPAARRKVIRELCRDLVVVPFDGAAALDAAAIRAGLAARGELIGPMDLLIAGTARSRGALLVTGNMREFSRVEGLRLADWTTA